MEGENINLPIRKTPGNIQSLASQPTFNQNIPRSIQIRSPDSYTTDKSSFYRQHPDRQMAKRHHINVRKDARQQQHRQTTLEQQHLRLECNNHDNATRKETITHYKQQDRNGNNTIILTKGFIRRGVSCRYLGASVVDTSGYRWLIPLGIIG